MKVLDRKTMKVVIKVSVYLILFTCFIVFYFIGQLQSYMKSGTTFGIRTESQNEFYIPDTAICFDPGFKNDVIH